MARVLVVDDEKSIRNSLGAFLEISGHSVSLAADAEQASSELETHGFDVVVCDIILPGHGGFEFLEQVRDMYMDLQIILITGEPGVKAASRATQLGAFDYIAKPVSREKIVAVVAAAADHKALLAQKRKDET